MSQSEDIDAVNQFMIDQRRNTKNYPSLTGILDSWDKWYAELDWTSKVFDSVAWIKAKQYREQVETVYKTYKPLEPGKPSVPDNPIIPDVLKPANSTQAIRWLTYGTGAIIAGLIILKVVKLVPQSSGNLRRV
jgi:hypothetical protein